MNKWQISLLVLFTLSSCDFREKTADNLSKEDKSYLKNLGVLQEGENVLAFKSNSRFRSFKKSGNLITDQRVASYWIDKNEKKVNSAFYPKIDSIKPTDLVSALTYASYLEVYSDSNTFKVYIDADSTRTWQFFELAIKEWKKHIN